MIDLDLVHRPFTDRLSRLVVTRVDDGSLTITRIGYEDEETVLSGVRVRSASGAELVVRSARPDRVSFDGDVHLVFASPDTILLVGSGARAVWSGGSAAIEGCLRLTGSGGHLPPRAVLEDSEKRWRAWFDLLPQVRAGLRDAAALAWWTLGINQLSIRARTGVVPSKYGYVAVWNWDSYFHAIGLRHTAPELAREQIRILLDHQRPDGLIPDVVHDHGTLTETTDLPRSDHARLAQHVGSVLGMGPPADPVPVTKPPLAAWAAVKVGDVEFLREVYPKLVRSQEWWLALSDPDGDGLSEYLHPYSSGLDDSPIWDYGPRAEPPDLNAYLARQFDALGDIADLIGADPAPWRRRAQRHVDLMVKLRWNGERFITLAAGAEVPVRTPLELLPLFTGRLPREISDKLVKDLLSESFWSDRPVPTVAFDDPAFDPDAMWRGPVWLNINYLLIDGLRHSGYPAEALELRERTLSMVRDGGGMHEYWNPLTGQRATGATTGFGWTAALFLDLAVEAW